jgi:hypothetical protein
VVWFVSSSNVRFLQFLVGSRTKASELLGDVLRHGELLAEEAKQQKHGLASVSKRTHYRQQVGK